MDTLVSPGRRNRVVGLNPTSRRVDTRSVIADRTLPRQARQANGILFVTLTVVVLDQMTKALVRGTLAPCSARFCEHVQLGPVSLINQTNTGGALSAGPGLAAWV